MSVDSSLWERIIHLYFDPLLNNTSYCTGYIVGIISFILLVLFVKTFILDPWKKIKAFFAATKKPATNDGPSPANTLMGCFMGILAIIICFGVIFLFVYFSQDTTLSLP